MKLDRDRFNSRPQAAIRLLVQRLVLKPTTWRVTKVTVIGQDNVTHLDGAFVVIANHASHLDAPLILGALPRRQAKLIATCVAADYFFNTASRRILTTLFFNAFPVNRTGSSAQGSDAKALLQRGIPLLLFPEGTRSRNGGKTLGRFKPGAAALAMAAGVPCVPVALIGTGIAHPRGSRWPGPGRLPVGVVFGMPIYPQHEENALVFTARIRAEIEQLIAAHSKSILGSVETSEGKAA